MAIYRIVTLHAGAANLLFAKELSKTEVINDINAELITLFRVVRYHRREFISELNNLCHSRIDFADYRSQQGLTDIQKAARFWFIAKASFGGKAGTTHAAFGYGTTGRARFRRTAFSAIRRCHRRLDGVYVENLDFADCITRYDRPWTAFYCDPPYYQTGGYKSKFDKQEHSELADVLLKIKGKFLLTINDHPMIRQLYKGLPRIKVEVKYSVARWTI